MEKGSREAVKAEAYWVLGVLRDQVTNAGAKEMGHLGRWRADEPLFAVLVRQRRGKPRLHPIDTPHKPKRHHERIQGLLASSPTDTPGPATAVGSTANSVPRRTRSLVAYDEVYQGHLGG